MKWIAHRGASYEAPENTLAAIKLAMKDGADAVEIDIRLTEDNRVVLMHDESTGRTCNEDYRVAEVSYNKVSSLDAGLWKDVRWQGESVPLLEDVLQAAPLLIHILVGSEIIPVLNTIFSDKGNNNVEIISASLDLLKEAKKTWPDIPLYWIAFPKNRESIIDMISTATEFGFTGLDLCCCSDLDAETVDRIHRADLKFYVWVVDDPDAAKKCLQIGVDGITSNRAAWLRENI